MKLASILKEAERIFGQPCSLLSDKAGKPLVNVGGECVIIAVQDPCGRRVAFRTQRTSPHFAPKLILREVKHRQAIEEAGVEGFQRLVAFDATYENAIGSPYIVLEWVEGVDRLQWSDVTPSCQNHRAKVIRAVANASLDLLKLNCDGSSATEYINAKIDALAEAERIYLTEQQSKTDYAYLRQQAKRYIIPELEHAPHVLVHGDLSAANIMVDDDFNVRCIVDMGSAHMVPLQFAAVFPLFLIHYHDILESKVDSSTCMPAVWYEDREFYLRCVKEKAEVDGGLARQLYHVIRIPEEFDRYWWFLESTQKNRHVSQASGRWISPDSLVVE